MRGEGSVSGSWVERFKPAAPARAHMLFAALMWLTVGGLLLALGVLWTLQVRTPMTPWLLAAAAAAGWIKARFALEPVARRTVDRIESRGDGRCIGGFFSIQSWTMVVIMIGAGRLLRGSVLSSHAVGLVYVFVGTALLIASRVLWGAWIGARLQTGGQPTDSPR
jgi:hypothetical protein